MTPKPRQSIQPLANILANRRAKIAHTPTVITPSEDAGSIPAKTQAIITPAANIAPTLLEILSLTNSPQCLHFLASANISSLQNEHFRVLVLVIAVVMTLVDMGFPPSKLVVICECRTVALFERTLRKSGENQAGRASISSSTA